MSEKRDRQIDLLFIVLGILILMLLFMPDPYADYRKAGYVGVAVFLAFLLVREIRRRKKGERRETRDERREIRDEREMETIDVVDLGVIEYGAAYQRQREAFDALTEAKRRGQAGRQMLLLCEHPHVYTLGKSGTAENLLVSEDFLQAIGATYFNTDRGGDITYHGYGQLVGYPILDLERLGMGLKDYINALEESVIRTVADFGLRGERLDGATGVWLEAGSAQVRKICAIGVKASRFVTMHGFALNVNTDLNYFSHINPCGFVDKGVTSLRQELGREVEMEQVKRLYTKHFFECMEEPHNKEYSK